MGLTELKVLMLMLKDEPRGYFNKQVSEALGQSWGAVHRVLLSMERRGLIRGEWETTPPHDLGRPQRCYYYLTQLGRQVAERRYISEVKFLAQLRETGITDTRRYET